jgi:hypothetical protein
MYLQQQVYVWRADSMLDVAGGPGSLEHPVDCSLAAMQDHLHVQRPHTMKKKKKKKRNKAQQLTRWDQPNARTLIWKNVQNNKLIGLQRRMPMLNGLCCGTSLVNICGCKRKAHHQALTRIRCQISRWLQKPPAFAQQPIPWKPSDMDPVWICRAWGMGHISSVSALLDAEIASPTYFAVASEQAKCHSPLGRLSPEWTVRVLVLPFLSAVRLPASFPSASTFFWLA